MKYYKEVGLITTDKYIIGTGSITGVYYPTGGAIAQLVNKTTDTHNIRLSIMSTPGSVYNIENLMNYRIEFGLVQSDTQYQAYYGFGEWNAVGPLQNSLDALTSLGIHPIDDITPFYETADNALIMFKSGQIDAFFYTVGHPSSIIEDILSNEIMPAHLVPIKGYGLKLMVSGKPYYSMTTITSEMYPDAGITEEIETFGVKATLVTFLAKHEIVYFNITFWLYGYILGHKSKNRATLYNPY